MINSIEFSGIITKKDMVHVKSGHDVCNLVLQHTDERSRVVEMTVSCWGNSAMSAMNSFEVGEEVLVRGKLTMQVWKDKAGKQRSRVYITALASLERVQPEEPEITPDFDDMPPE